MWLQHMVVCTVSRVGEFGVVYRAKLLRKQGKSDPGFVAMKTMRGVLQLGSKQCYIIAGLVSTSNVRIQ